MPDNSSWRTSTNQLHPTFRDKFLKNTHLFGPEQEQDPGRVRRRATDQIEVSTSTIMYAFAGVPSCSHNADRSQWCQTTFSMRNCLRRWTYSASAAVTASFLVLCPPTARASSISRSSSARFVAIILRPAPFSHMRCVDQCVDILETVRCGPAWCRRRDSNLSRFAGVSAAEARRRNPERSKDPSNLVGAEEGTRTPTPLRVHGPEPCASANSATSARVEASETFNSLFRKQALLYRRRDAKLAIALRSSPFALAFRQRRSRSSRMS